MASFLQEAHGRLTAQRQIYIAEQLGLGKALFQEFRKDPKQEVLLHLDPGHLSHLDCLYSSNIRQNCTETKRLFFQAHIRVFGLRSGPKRVLVIIVIPFN